MHVETFVLTRVQIGTSHIGHFISELLSVLIISIELKAAKFYSFRKRTIALAS